MSTSEQHLVRWTTDDETPYRVTIELDLMPSKTGPRVDARRIIIEMTDQPMTADAWRRILPLPLIHRAADERADEVLARAGAEWAAAPDDRLGPPVVQTGAGPRPATEAEIASLHETRTRARDQRLADVRSEQERSKPRTRKRRVALGDRAKVRDRVAQLHQKALTRGSPAPRRYVIQQLAAEGLEISTATATALIREAIAKGLTGPANDTRTSSKEGR